MSNLKIIPIRIQQEYNKNTINNYQSINNKRMNKKTLLRAFALLTLLLLPAQVLLARVAEENVTCMVLTLNDGTVNRFALTDMPMVTYEGENRVVSTGDEQFTTALSGIKQLSFEQVPTGISEMIEESPKPVFTPGQARFEGLKTHATVSIYTFDGKMLSSMKANDEGSVSIDLSTLPQGVYILRTPNQSYKIKK